MAAALSRAITQGRMDGYPEEHSVNWLDSETQKRLCRQSQELLQRAQTRAVNWSSLVEDLRREEKPISLNTSFKTMAEYMDYVSSQCGRFHNLAPEKAALNHVCRYHRNQLNPMSSSWVRQKKSTSHDPLDPAPSKLDPAPSRLDPGPSKLDPYPSKLDLGPSKFDPRPSKFVARTRSKDITIEVSSGTYAVTVGSPSVTTTKMIEVDSGKIIDLSFPL
ncbi:A-kinase-interacting protein 1-like [Petaurus breviceps papuanus]|uniref:A-kinase-interacting protein 1-like n=1 Tax=Petaurus breviceps papuanus TaxID=3040969 RepID=UPI0036DF2798